MIHIYSAVKADVKYDFKYKIGELGLLKVKNKDKNTEENCLAMIIELGTFDMFHPMAGRHYYILQWYDSRQYERKNTVRIPDPDIDFIIHRLKKYLEKND